MNYILIAVLLAVAQASSPVPRKTPDNSARASSHTKNDRSAKQQPTAQPVSSVHPNEPPTAKRDTGQQGSNNAEHTVGISKLPPVSVTRHWPDWGLWVFNLLLVGVGGFQVWLLFRTFGAIKRQADNMDRQTGILGESVKAANASAKAAQENIDLFINRERARLRVKPLDFDLWQEAEVEVSGAPVHIPRLPAHPVTYVVSFYGPTPAFIVDSAVRASLQEIKEPIPDYADRRWMMRIGLPDIITSNTELKPFQSLIWEKMFLKPEDIEKIKKGSSFIHFYGFIKYKDVFDKPRDTFFHLRWKVGQGMPGKEGGQWVKCGPEDANRST